MKRFIYTLLISFFVFVNNANAQENKTIIDKNDEFSFKKVNILHKERGKLSVSGNGSEKKTNIEPIAAENRGSNSGIGETPGSLSVSLTGAVNYTIPIAVPPGIDGIVPQISLGYNSQGGNGLAGYGWNINGVSVISRIPSSKFHDNQIDGVDFDNLDRFALDGERLILKSGTYGTDGAEYETENYSNLKITSHGTSSYGASYGPSYFLVQYPDGSTARYGDSLDSRSHTNYAITYWENPQNVRVSYEYVISYNSQSISKIKYGSLNDNTPINEIRFSYETLRKKPEHAYINNVKFVRKYLLSAIESYSNEVRYRKYSLNHTHSTDSNGDYYLRQDRLKSLTEFSGDATERHSSISFNYSSSQRGITYNEVITDLGLIDIEQRNSQVASLDMTGNGKMDFIVFPNSKNKFWMFYDIQSGGYNYPYEVNTGSFESIFPSTLLNDQNRVLSGQGLTIVQKGNGNEVKFKVYSKASSTTGLPIGYDYTKIWNSPTYSYQNSPSSYTTKQISKEYVSGDFNGDGLTDVLAIGKPYTNRSCYQYSCKQGGKVMDVEKQITQLNDENDLEFNKRKAKILSDFEKNQENRIPDEGGPGDPGDPGDGTCYSCTTYGVNHRSVYFINLRRDIPSDFVNPASSLQLELSGDYKLKTGDFNGDGKTDLFHITNGKIYIYTLDDNNYLILLHTLTDSGISVSDPLLFGDYNGDGKTDFLAPTANNSYIFRTFLSTGVSFDIKSKQQPFKYQKTNWNGNNGVLTGYNLVPVDINGDGKTDIIDYTTVTYNDSSNGTQTIREYINRGFFNAETPQVSFTSNGAATRTGNLKHFPIPVFLTSSKPNKSLDFASISNKWVTNFTFSQDHREDVLLRNIYSNGVSYEIEYSNLDASITNENYYAQIFQPSHNQVYPNIDLGIAPSTKVVTTLHRRAVPYSSEIIPTKKVYFYQGAVYNAEGLGFLGFQSIAKSNWFSDNSDRIFSVSKFDPSLRGAMTEEYSTAYSFSFTTPTTNYISKTTYQHSSSLSSSKVFKLWIDSSLTQNNLEGTFSNTTYQYDLYNNPETITTSFLGGSKTKNITYSNSTGSDYHIGRPLTTTSTTTIGSETFNTGQEFAYSGYLLTERKIKGNGTPFDIETFDYDAFSNIRKKTITPNGESPRVVEFEYDTTGRFIIKSTDIEGLETNYEYNLFGNLTRETNPFNQSTVFEHDSWFRQIKIIDYLGNEVVTDFTEEDYAYTVTNTADDGSGMIVKYDQFQRASEIKEKNVFGDWIGKKYEYDAQGRVVKESEPYTGDNVSQWNETSYDLYGRPTSQTLHTGRTINISYSGLSTTVDDGVKTVTSTKNQLGHITAVTDPGGTINYNYYGNGNLKTANYNGVIVSTEQDGWGRKTKLIDPSAGTFEYDYNGFGELVNETTPKGYTDYVYSPLGKLLEKNISGDNTPGTSIVYSYNPLKKYLDGIVVTSADGNNSTYVYGYDDDDRLESVSETNPYAQFTNQYTYDGFGRIETEEYYAKLLLNNKTSTKKIKNLYQNGQLKNIRDFSTNNNIWDATSVNARGQLTSGSIGNIMTHTNSYNTYGYLTNSSIKKDTGSAPEVLIQLTTDFDVERGTLNSRSNSMFSWSETFGYDNLDRLITFNDNEGDNTLNYDNLGRITFNNTVGDYNYSGTSYQVANIDLNNQGDLYYQQNRLEQIKYNAFKKPFEIYEEGKEKVGFQYNAFMGRSSMFYGDTEDDVLDRNNRKHYSSDGSMEISYDENTNKTLFVTYIGGNAYSAPAIWRSESILSNTTEDYFYLHRDYLGSILLITDGDGTAQEKRHFDAWGKIVKLTDGNDNNLDKLTFLDRGYTGHEHLQGVNLIHMNGRLYDPSLKRFLSADNFIQDINNTQNFNRYGYVLNNPLLYVDPSGESYSGPGGNCVECDYNNNGPKYDYQNSLDGAQSVPIEIDFRGFRNWVSNNFKSGLSDIGNLFEAIGDLFKKGDRPPVEYSNYDGLSSDPLAGPIADTPTSFFGGGGTADGGLGISNSNTVSILESLEEKQDFSGFWGTANYIWTGGNIDGVRYSYSGDAVGLSPMMGIVPVGPGKVVKAAESTRKVVVIGENMAGRVIPYAKKYGYKYFKPRGTNPANWMKNQVQWIQRQLKDPWTTIIDIGPKGAVPTSKYYLKELEMILKWFK